MNRLIHMLATLGILLVACGAPSGVPATPLPTLAAPTAGPEPGYPAPTPAPSPTPASYPLVLPTMTAPAPGYPVEEHSWLLKPVGLQCQQSEVDLDGAVADLETAGIEVFTAQMVGLMVCTACDTCPTSQHYRVEIESSQVEAARSLGWEPEP